MTLESKIFTVWALLIAATLLSWFLGGGGTALAADEDYRLTTVVIIIVACIKIRLVGIWFMELREAIRPLRIAFEGYVIGVCALMIWFYLK